MPDAVPRDHAVNATLDRLDAEREHALERLFALLKIPSVSTDPAYADHCRAAADWLVDDLASMGFEAAAHSTQGHPIVLATDHDSDGPHVLFYGHYDVQPPEPLDLWHGDPFTPALVTRPDGSGMIRARGANDDKGQLMTFLEACRAWKAVAGKLPCKVTMLIEGEEESGGKSLPPFLEAHRDLLASASIALVCDTGMWDSDTPAITTMLRGNLTEEVTVKGPDRDLHSGFYGGAAANPITVLSRAIAAIHDETGHVSIPGFYDGVPDVPRSVLDQWMSLSFEAESFLGEVGLRRPAGETAFSCLEQTWSRPTAELNGIWGGYTGAGFKTVIPAEAHAKISFRLVGDQDPEAIRDAFRAFIRAQLPEDCTAEFISHGAGRAIAMPTEAPDFEKAREALTEEWGKEAAFIGCGGSIPVVGQFKRALDLDSLLVGFGLPDDALHSPNEKYDVKCFEKGARSWARILAALAT
ncbi:MAG: M20/M25/M40 family metallo-hydrolase [Pseudomonadota bacterium]